MKFVKRHPKSVGVVSIILALATVAKGYFLWGTFDLYFKCLTVIFFIAFVALAVYALTLKKQKVES